MGLPNSRSGRDMNAAGCIGLAWLTCILWPGSNPTMRHECYEWHAYVSRKHTRGPNRARRHAYEDVSMPPNVDSEENGDRPLADGRYQGISRRLRKNLPVSSCGASSASQ